MGDLGQLDESEAPKAGHARVYLVPMRTDVGEDAQHDDFRSAEAILQVWKAAGSVHMVETWPVLPNNHDLHVKLAAGRVLVMARTLSQVAGLLQDGAATKHRCSLPAVAPGSMSDEAAAAGWQAVSDAVGTAADGHALVVECATASDAARLLAEATKCSPDAFAPSPGGITLLTVSVEHRTLQQVACFNHCGHL